MGIAAGGLSGHFLRMSKRVLIGLLFASLVANFVLVVALLLSWEPGRPMEVTLVRPAVVTNVFRPIRTNIVVEARPLRWHDLESTNYARFISNLRSIGCPEATVRDIIGAEINGLFAARRARELLLSRHQWWRLEPDPALVAATEAQRRAIEEERVALLSRLLGPAASPPGELAEEGTEKTPLDGPLLGELTDEAKAAVRAVEKLRDQRLEALAAAGTAVSPLEAARLEGVIRTNLAAVLSPEQLEEYLLRYSRTADQLRRQAAELDLDPDAFRALFHALDPVDRRLAALEGQETTEAAVQKVELLALREAALQDSLSPEQYAEYTLNQDPAYTSKRDRLRDLGLPDRHAVPLFQIDQVTQEEIARLRADGSLGEEELAAELELVEQQRLEAVQAILGPEGYSAFQGSMEP